ncbi:unnamed protein product [Danaus chrysippus]|uniref:(African queen) hypothetical protein n=1 Tax=Danaus chrysippus TaxID=151541 RepID=A0A8J2QEP4_9NEOP|nr:unnamed protein product [Danaus chrysippus]
MREARAGCSVRLARAPLSHGRAPPHPARLTLHTLSHFLSRHKGRFKYFGMPPGDISPPSVRPAASAIRSNSKQLDGESSGGGVNVRRNSQRLTAVNFTKKCGVTLRITKTSGVYMFWQAGRRGAVRTDAGGMEQRRVFNESRAAMNGMQRRLRKRLAAARNAPEGGGRCSLTASRPFTPAYTLRNNCPLVRPISLPATFRLGTASPSPRIH